MLNNLSKLYECMSSPGSHNMELLFIHQHPRVRGGSIDACIFLIKKSTVYSKQKSSYTTLLHCFSILFLDLTDLRAFSKPFLFV